MDVAKGILIIMVIVGHIAANSKSKYGIESQTLVGFDEVCRLYTCFFMQAFFSNNRILYKFQYTF